MTNFREMLERAKSGKLSNRELDVAMKAISGGCENRQDLYTALHVVGLAGSPTQAEAVKRHLCTPADPMLSRLALQILCDYWGMSSDFLSELQGFLAGVDWDVDGDVREIAIPIAGRRLREAGEPVGLAHVLTNIAEDEGEIDILREAALRALATALGDSLLDVSSPAVRVRVGSTQAIDVLARARQRYALQ